MMIDDMNNKWNLIWKIKIYEMKSYVCAIKFNTNKYIYKIIIRHAINIYKIIIVMVIEWCSKDVIMRANRYYWAQDYWKQFYI